jgi:hypothetical protein
LNNPGFSMTDDTSDDLCGGECSDGTPCERPAGWGTDHAGEGRCKLHGGNAGRPVKHGRYSVKAREGLEEKIRQYQEEENPAEQWDELALLRALLQEWLDDLDTLDEDTVSVILDLQTSIRRTLDTINKIQTRTALTQAEVEYLQARMADVLKTHVPKDRRADALDDLKALTTPSNQRRN